MDSTTIIRMNSTMARDVDWFRNKNVTSLYFKFRIFTFSRILRRNIVIYE